MVNTQKNAERFILRNAKGRPDQITFAETAELMVKYAALISRADSIKKKWRQVSGKDPDSGLRDTISKSIL